MEKPTQLLKHISDEKLSLNWNKLIAAIHCTGWSAFTVKAYTILQTDYDDYDDYNENDNLSEQNDWVNGTPPAISMIVDCNEINGNGGYL